MLSPGVLFLYLLAPVPDSSGEPPPPAALTFPLAVVSPALPVSSPGPAGAPSPALRPATGLADFDARDAAFGARYPVRRHLMLALPQRDRRRGADAIRRPRRSPTW